MRLWRENQRLDQEVGKARKVIEIQGNLWSLLHELAAGSQSNDSEPTRSFKTAVMELKPMLGTQAAC